jgi:hypothetical protein
MIVVQLHKNIAITERKKLKILIFVRIQGGLPATHTLGGWVLMFLQGALTCNTHNFGGQAPEVNLHKVN